MTQSVIGALRVNLGLDSAQFERGLGSASKRLADMRGRFAAFSAAAGAVGVALGGLTIATARSANELTRMAQVANTSPAELQRMAAATRTVGIDADKLSDILKDVNDRIGDYIATGGGEMADFFENIAPKVGVTAEQFRKLSGPDALQLYVSSLEKAGASQQDMTFYLEAMASDATALLPLLRDNGAEMARLSGRAESLGSVMDDEATAALRRAHLAFGDVGNAMQGIGNRIAVELAPGLMRLANAFTNSMLEGGTLRVMSDALIGNLDRLATYAATAATFLGARYVSALVATRAMTVAVNLQTLGLVGSMKLLRGAIMRTGFGALVIASAEIGMWFGRLVKSAGSFGGALSLLGDIGREVWGRIGDGGRGLYLILQGVATGVASAFAQGFAWIGEQWDKVVNGMREPFNGLMESMGLDARMGASAIGEELGGVADAWEKTAVSKIEEGGALLKAAATTPLESLAALKEIVGGVGEEAVDGAAAGDALADALAGDGGGVSGAADKAGKATNKLSDAAKAAKKRLDELKSAAESWTDRVATPVEKYRKQLEELNAVAAAGLIGDETKARGIKALNLELADSTPLVGELVDAVTGSMFDGFRATLDSITSFFKRWLSQMIATAAKNQIVVSMGGSFGVPGAGAMGSGLMSSMGGVLGGIGSTLSGLGTTFFQNAIGIFGADMAGLGATLAGATSSLTGFAAAAGALALPIAVAVAAFDFFRQKTKKLDEGVRLTTEGMTTAVQSWERIRKTRFWGLSTDTDNHYSGAPSDVASPLKQAVGEMQAGIVQAADALGVGRRAFADFSHQIKLSTKGMTEDEAVRALQEELGGLGEAFAAMVPGVHRLRAAGESAADALARTATSLTTVNSAFRTLGFDRLDESLRGGRTANRLVELSGGLDQFAQATEYYFQNIMSAPDRLKALTRQFNQALDAANINARPGSAGQFQRQVERMMGNGARRKATALINLAPLFTEIQRLQGELDTTGDKADGAADRLAAREQKAADIARERAGLEAQLLRLSGDQKAIRQAELADLYPANRALQSRIYQLEREAEAAEEATRVADERLGLQRQVWQLTGNTAAIQKDLLASLSPANRALQQHVWGLEKQAEAAEKASAILDERRGLEGTLLGLQGNTAEIRRRELLSLDPSNRALQQRVWKLEDEVAAAERASAVADERLGIQRQIWELTGNTAAIQRDLLSALDPSNRALQQHAWSLEKQAEAAEKASGIADERTSLENRLLELQGNTAELRRRELTGLDASNRALQLMIWGLEDAAAAMEALDPADFTSRLDFERARARAANGAGGVTSTGVPLAVIPQTPAQTVQTDNAALLREIRDLNKQMLGNGVEGEGHLFRMVRIIREWDRSGLPQERSA
ncbi:MAG: hypothetical protein ACU0E9_04760 [Limimaricola soesokkakensis]|uniref:hypothetical protein n=1 Tax=Limimaricola soesokkakensis TaxID=1343159 RepID=UPI004058BA4B